MENFIKKIIIIGIVSLFLGTGYQLSYWEFTVPNYGYSVNFPYDNNPNILNLNECNTNSWNCTDLWNQIEITGNNSMINNLISVFGLDTDIINQDEHKFINYARAILNIALWLLSLIALIMTIYTFYMMFFTENEAWIKKAKWNLVGIFIALAIIGLARLIVSFIFRRYQSNWQNALII